MITVKDLYKDFGENGEIKVLKGVSEHIEKGEKVVIIGPLLSYAMRRMLATRF